MSAPAAKTNDPRKGLLAKVHIAKKDLALAEQSYRDVLARVTGKTSAADLSIARLEDVLAEFRRLGWKPKPGRRGKPARAGRRPLATSAQAGKLRALWLSLYHLGAVRDPSEDALAHFVARQTGVEALQWTGPEDANKAIEALKDWCAREGFAQPDAKYVDAVNEARALAGLPGAGPGFAAKTRLIFALWDKLSAAGAMRAGVHANLGTWLMGRFGVAAPQFLDGAAAADRAVEALGAWLRETLDGRA